MKTEQEHHPPKIARFLLRLFTGYNSRHSVEDDFKETFFEIKKADGAFKAGCWYWSQVIKSLPGFYDLFINWGIIMFGSNFKLIFRNIKKYKLFSFLNILGLAVGMTCFILIMFYIKYELSFDDFHNDADKIYRVTCALPDENEGKSGNSLAITPAPLSGAAKERFPEIEYATRYNCYGNYLLTYKETCIFERGIFADENFFKVFSFNLLKGNEETVMSIPTNIVISESLAAKFFGEQDPMGKTLTCSLGDFNIAGILEDVPENSQLQFDWMIPFAMQFSPDTRDGALSAWNWDSYYTYFKMKGEFNKEDFEKKLNVMTKEFNGNWDMRLKLWYSLQPLDEVHTTEGFMYELGPITDIGLIRLFTIVAIFILVIACINTMNLATANASKRAKEIGVRKVIGSRRIQLFWQFTGESITLSAISFLIAVMVVALLLPSFNSLVERNIGLEKFINMPVIIALIFTVLLTGLLSGLYPAIFLSSMKPARVFKEKVGSFTKGISFRNLLVLFQFSLTIILLIATMVVFQQINFIKNKDLGYDINNVLMIPGSDTGINNKFDVFKNDLMQNPDIVDITTASQIPFNIENATGVQFTTDTGETKTVHYQCLNTDYNFTDMFDIEILQGRGFSKEFGIDSAHAILINETFLKEIGWANPIDHQTPPVWFGFAGDFCTVVGVVKDFTSRSLSLDKKSVIIGCQPNSFWKLIRYRGENSASVLKFVEEKYNEYKTRFPFRHYFLDEQYQQMYQSEQKLGDMILYANILAIFIACLGIFGLSIYTAERRIKEIGIRKTLGATIPGIVILLMRGFVKWIVLANIISWPVSYYFAEQWLDGYANSVDLQMWIFITAGFTALAIALLTVSYQAVRAAKSNPVDSLKYE